MWLARFLALVARSRRPAEIELAQQTGVDAAGDLLQRFHLVWRQDVEYEAANLADAEQLAMMLALLDSMPKPTLARVNGDGYGGALGLLGACDVAVAVEDAKFAFTEVRLGIIPAVVSPFVLGKIGESAARRYFLTAETLTAATLRELGLVHEVVPGELLDAACTRIAEALLKGAPQALAEAKTLISDVSRAAAPHRAAASIEAAARLARLRIQAEAQEGFNAFFAKRKASWRRD